MTHQGALRGALERLGFTADQIVVEFGYDSDVDEEVRGQVEALTEGALEGDDYDGVVDAVLLWWRDGEGDLADELVDAMSTLDDGGFIILLTPGPGMPDRVPAHELQEACTTCSLSAAGPVPVGEWIAQRLVGRR